MYVFRVGLRVSSLAVGHAILSALSMLCLVICTVYIFLARPIASCSAHHTACFMIGQVWASGGSVGGGDGARRANNHKSA